MEEPTVIIFHQDCFDGMAAAWVAMKYFKSRGKETILHPARYGDDPPYDSCQGRDVYVIDFSYPREKLIRLHLMTKSLLVLDHHKTAQADLEGLSYTIFDMERSGAGLAWDWFFPGEPRHWMVNTIEDRDLWRMSLPGTEAIMAWIATVPFTFEDYDLLSRSDIDDTHALGLGILRYIDNYGKKAAMHSLLRSIGGFVFPVMNIPYMNCSEHLNKFIERSGGDRAASFFMTKEGKWQFSLRSRGDFDVSAIAQKFGGGGHKNAAGFMIDHLPWEPR